MKNLNDIKKEPILNWYLEVFENALNSADTKLFILGYGFHDYHRTYAFETSSRKSRASEQVVVYLRRARSAGFDEEIGQMRKSYIR